MLSLNTIHHGDCLELMKEIPDKSVDLVVIDPPYNIKKDKWDNIENYQSWIKSILIELQRVLRDNGSFYMFHSEMEVIADLMQWFRLETNFVFRQFIIWNKRFKGSPKKGFLDGYVVVDGLRNYQQMAEYILYYTFQDETGLSKIMSNCVYPIRDYIRSEIIKAKGKIVLKEINKVLGTATNGGGVASACLSVNKTCPAMITEEHYLKLRDWLNDRKEYEYLRKEYEDLRYTFNNQKTHHSVWNYDIEKKQGHVTPKPLELIKNIILHSSKKNQIVLDCFMGSGTTALACQETNRNYIGIEKESKYIDIANKRLSQKSLFQSYESNKPEVTQCDLSQKT
jgi:site-specific DNA-methyltransferase (adenine-specific)